MENESANASKWHAGERTLQQRAGVADLLEEHGEQIFRSVLAANQRRFFSLLPFVVVGSVDRYGDAWPTVLSGPPGFLQTASDEVLRIGGLRDPMDPALADLSPASAIGLLGIDLQQRRRSRVNGRIREATAQSLDIRVEQSYGNCPSYIKRRAAYQFVRDAATFSPYLPAVSASIDARAAGIIALAETLFIASYVDLPTGARQVDVSHKGGRPGFVGLGDDGALTIPDYSGNKYFNTLGNIFTNPKCGLIFIDFASGDTVQLTGEATLLLEGTEFLAFEQAQHLLRFQPRRVVFRAGALPLRWADAG